MFKRLQQKWKVGPLQIIFIIICFAVGGAVTGFAAKKIMNVLLIRQDWLWAIIYIVLVTIIWPIAVVTVSLFFGQFTFFSGYVLRLLRKLGVVQSSGFRVQNSGQMANIAIFASGAGSNAQKIIEHFNGDHDQKLSKAKVALVVCNKPGAGVIKIAEQNNIPVLIIVKEIFFHGNGYIQELRSKKIDFIVLAGFLWKIPDILIKAYHRRIINIHPALLPKYGGKGMYGNYVHETVIAGKEKESGITIHYVDEHYDNGDIILQVKCPVLEDDTAESLARRIHALEHANYPVVIEELVSQLGS
jgi:formyltetrahydrofolate-dependent phosphoribosylglycinamide formyltransferase